MKTHDKTRDQNSANYRKLSDGGGWRDGCAGEGGGAASVTAGAVRCSAWLGDSFDCGRAMMKIEAGKNAHNVKVDTLRSNLEMPRRLDERAPKLAPVEIPRCELQLCGHENGIVVAAPRPEACIGSVLPNAFNRIEVVTEKPRSSADKEQTALRHE